MDLPYEIVIIIAQQGNFSVYETIRMTCWHMRRSLALCAGIKDIPVANLKLSRFNTETMVLAFRFGKVFNKIKFNPTWGPCMLCGSKYRSRTMYTCLFRHNICRVCRYELNVYGCYICNYCS